MRRARRGPSQLAYSWQRERVRRLEHWSGENSIRDLAGGSCDVPSEVPPNWPILGRERVRRLEHWSGKNLIRLGWWFMRRARRGPSQLVFSWQRESVRRLEHWSGENSIQLGWCHYRPLLDVTRRAESQLGCSRQREGKKTRALERREFYLGHGWWFMRRSRQGPSQLAYSWQREGKKTRELVQKEFNLVQGKGSQHLPPLIDVSSSWAILQERE
jgi:hypothetical protein